MRILLRDLSPGTAYALQLRSNSADSVSEWSRVFTLTTDSDTVAPAKPTGVAGSMAGTSFKLDWNQVILSTDGTLASDFDRYEVLVASTGTATTGVYVTKDNKFEFSLEMNTMLFGSPRANIIMSVRAVDKVGNTDGYTSTVSQTNAAPAAPTSLNGVAGIDVLTFKWTGVADLDLKEYRVYSGTVVGTQTTLVWSGRATNASIQSIDYATDRYYKVVAVDVFNTESATSNVVGPLKPTSPFVVDTTAPGIPTGLAITLSNATDGKTANAAVTWTAVSDPDNDLAEYIVDYKPSAASDWQTVKVDYTKTSTRIDGLLPYTNYDFRIRAADFSANLSNWSSTVTKTATANANPATPTGLAITAARDNIQLSWNENSEVDMVNNAGTYDVTVATNSGFTTGVLQYRTGNTTLAVNGLNTNTQYWARVRAVDSGGLVSAYSASVNATTSSFPSTPLSDGNVPTGAPTVVAAAGIGYVYLNWTPVANADPVVYDVYMSTTNGFTTYDATTKITEVFGTSAIVDTTVAGASLVYGTTYYFKVRARDRDGSSASISAQASASPFKASTSDISTVDASLITSNTSFTTNLFIGSGGAIQSTGYTSGGTTGFQLSNNGLTIKGTNNVIDAGVLKGGTITGTTINVGAGGVLNIDSTAVVKSNNYAAGSTGYQLSSTGLEINDGTIDAKALKTGTAVIGDLTIGRSADSVGTMKSFDYVAGSTGWKIGKGLAEFNTGTIRAAALQLQDSVNIMHPQYASFEFAPSYYVTGAGNTSIGVNNTLSIQTGTPKYGKQVVRLTANIAASNFNFFGNTSTDYNIPLEEGQTYILSGYVRASGTTPFNFSIRIRGNDGNYLTTPGVALSTSWQRVQGQFTVPVGVTAGVFANRIDFTAGGEWIELDGIQLERKIANLNSASPWSPPGITSADGGIIRTGEIRSNTNTTVNGVSQPMWSINMAGNAQFGSAFVRGTMIVGAAGADADAGQSYIASGNYVANTTGWKIDSAGNLEANTGKIRGDLIVDGTLQTSKLAIGVIRTNPVNNPGFEEAVTFTNFTDAGTGDIATWRKGQSTNATVSINAGQTNSGNFKAELKTNATTGTTGDISDIFSNAILIEAGATYKLTFAAASTGAGAASAGGKLYVDALFGTTATTVSTGNAANQALSVVETFDAFGDPNGTNPYFTAGYTASGSITSSSYNDFSKEFTIPGGQTAVWMVLRFRNTGNAADTSIFLDDVAVIRTNIGGGAELTSAGLRLFGNDGEETVALVSNRPNYLNIQDGEGAVMASIDSTGNIAGISGAFSGATGATNDFLDSIGALSIGGEDYADRMSRLPQGVINQVYKNTLITVDRIRTEYGIYEIAFTAIPGRHYRVTFSGGTIHANTGAPAMSALARVRRTLDGSAPSITSPVVRSTWIGFPTNNVDITPMPVIVQGELTGGAPSPVTCRLLYTLGALNAGATDYIGLDNKSGTSAPASLECVVEDLGYDPPDTYQTNSGGGVLYTGGTDSSGGGTPSSVKKTYTQTWTANSSQTRRGTSGFGNNTVNTSAPTGFNLAGYYSSSNGNQYTYLGFTGTGSLGQTIGTAISGATVTKVELYVRNATFFATSGGSQRFGLSTLTAMPSSGSASSTKAAAYTANQSFNTGQGKWITLPSGAGGISTLTGGGRVAVIGPGSSNSQTYYSKWYDHVGSYAPQLRITYTK